MRKMTVAAMHLILSLIIAVLTVEGCISLWYGLNDVVCFVAGLGALLASTLCCQVLLQIILEYNPEQPEPECICRYCGSTNVGWYPDIGELQCNVCYVTM